MEKKKLTAKQFLKLYSDKNPIVTYEFGTTIFIELFKGLKIQFAINKAEAELWSELNKLPSKLDAHAINVLNLIT